MKSYSFYQFLKTKTGEKSDNGLFSIQAVNDPQFPIFSTDYDEISDYLEKTPYDSVSLDTYDTLFEEYKNWLNY